MSRLVAAMSTLLGPVSEMDEAASVAAEAALPWLDELEGFRGLLILTDEQGEKARVLTFWTTHEAAERSAATRQGLRDRMAETVGMDVEASENYVVAALRLDPE